MIVRKYSRLVVGGMLIGHGAWSAGSKYAPEVARHIEAVARRGKMIPISRIASGRITIDGDLSDWGDLRRNAIFIHQVLNRTYGSRPSGKPDAAVYKLAHDGEALYVAIRVVDAKTVYPPNGGDMKCGDRMEVFIDVRPVAGSGPTLGSANYSDGVYYLRFAPPVRGTGRVRWEQAGPEVRKIGRIDVAGTLNDGGYDLEVRLPCVSMALEAGGGRFSHPIGFEAYVKDVDTVPAGSTPVDSCGYSWGCMARCHERAAGFSCAAVNHEFNRKRPCLQTLLRMFRSRKGRKPIIVFRAAVVAVMNAKHKGAWVELSCDFRRSDYDGPTGAKVPDKPRMSENDTVIRETYPELGIAVHRRKLKLDSFVPGRYYIKAAFPGSAVPGREQCLYGRLDRGGVVVNAAFPGRDLDVTARLCRGTSPPILETHYTLGRKKVRGLAAAFPWDRRSPVRQDASTWFRLSEIAEEVAKAHRPFPFRFSIRLSRGGLIVWRTDVPIRPGGAKFAIPVDNMHNGVFMLSTAIVTPDRRTALPSLPLVVTPSRDAMLRTVVQDADPLLTHAEKIGQPSLAQFGKSDLPDADARGVHDLQLFAGRIYVGCGDWNRNRGPIDIWSFDPALRERPVKFVKEFTVTDESVDSFRIIDGKLYVPGIDACAKIGENWELGNLYVLSEHGWQKFRTVPNGVHVLDVARFNGKLYTATGVESGAALYESVDSGRSWKRCGFAPDRNALRANRFWGIAAMDSFLFVVSDQAHQNAYRFVNGRLEPLFIPLLPECGFLRGCRVRRLARFGEGVVYTARTRRGSPLFFLDDFTDGARIVALFQKHYVTDIVVRDGRCYVLTFQPAAPKRAAFKGEIHVSGDMKTWTRLAVFTVPAIPNSLEWTDNAFLVGLANAPRIQSAWGESGSIWRVAE